MIKCIVCEKDFKPVHGSQKICGKICKAKRQNLINNIFALKKIRLPKPCKDCGELLEYMPHHSRHYCNDCRDERNRNSIEKSNREASERIKARVRMIRQLTPEEFVELGLKIWREQIK